MTQEVETANPSQEDASGQTFDAGSEDEAVKALMGKSEADEATETSTDEPTDEADEEADKGEPEEAESKEELAEVEYDGKHYKVPPELQKALLRQADYSRKMGEVQAKEKDYTQRIETADKLIEGAETYAKALAQVSRLDDEIKQFEAVDFDALELSDPSRASILALKLMRLQTARDKALEGSKTIDAQLKAERAKSDDAKRGDMAKALAKDLPGWGDDLGTKITKYAMDKGYTVDEIRAVTDPKWVIAMDKARRYDAAQSEKATVKAKAKDAPPVVKPGAKRPATNGAQDAMSRLRKSNSSADAEAVFLARMTSR